MMPDVVRQARIFAILGSLWRGVKDCIPSLRLAPMGPLAEAVLAPTQFREYLDIIGLLAEAESGAHTGSVGA